MEWNEIFEFGASLVAYDTSGNKAAILSLIPFKIRRGARAPAFDR